MPRQFDNDPKSKVFNFAKNTRGVIQSNSNLNVNTKFPTAPGKDARPVWSDRSVKVNTKFNIEIPRNIELALLALNEEYDDVEYTILTKTVWDAARNSFIMLEDIFIPKQEVTRVHIDYNEDNIEFNTVIHKHPDGCMSFSGTDEEYINTNFDFSVLWVNRSFHIGYAKIKCEQYGSDCFMRIPLNITRQSVRQFLPEGAIDKIKRKTHYSWQRASQPGRPGVSGGRYVQHDADFDFSKTKDHKEDDYDIWGAFRQQFDLFEVEDEYTSFFRKDREYPTENISDYKGILSGLDEIERLAEASGCKLT